MERIFRLERDPPAGSPSGTKLPDANLYLGNHGDADNFQGQRLCVLEPPNCREGHERYKHIAILIDKDGTKVASRARLDEAADFITEMLQAGEDLLVHCAAGVERSPLTVAWWLVKVGCCANLDTAYHVIRSVRPQVEDRRQWLEPLQ